MNQFDIPPRLMKRRRTASGPSARARAGQHGIAPRRPASDQNVTARPVASWRRSWPGAGAEPVVALLTFADSPLRMFEYSANSLLRLDSEYDAPRFSTEAAGFRQLGFGKVRFHRGAASELVLCGQAGRRIVRPGAGRADIAQGAGQVVRSSEQADVLFVCQGQFEPGYFRYSRNGAGLAVGACTSMKRTAGCATCQARTR